MRTPVSGIQHTLRCDQYEAVIASVGASLRKLRHEGRDLVVPFEADELRPGYRGATLAPWPNRVVDGRYSFGGEEYELRADRAEARTRPPRPRAVARLPEDRRGPGPRDPRGDDRTAGRVPVARRGHHDLSAERRGSRADGDRPQHQCASRRRGAPGLTRISSPAPAPSTSGPSSCPRPRCCW